MERKEAVQFARNLFESGVKNPLNLATRLTEAGYISPLTGKPIGGSGAYAMAKYGKIRIHRKKRAPQKAAVSVSIVQPKNKTDRIKAVVEILKLQSLSESDRITHSLLILE